MIRGCFHIESGRGEEGAEGAAGSSVTGTGSLPSRGGFVDIEGVCIDIERGGRTSSAHVVDARRIRQGRQIKRHRIDLVSHSIDKHGQALLIHEIEVESYWTNLGVPPEDVIALYHDHGTSEQFQRKIRSDLNIERLPSNSYEVNKLFFALGVIAYNLLRAVDNRLAQHKDKWPSHLKKKRVKQKRCRAGSILKDIICIAGKLISHSGIKQMKIAKGWPWSVAIIAVHRELRISIC